MLGHPATCNVLRMMLPLSRSLRRRIACKIATPMSLLALTFLVCLATLIVLWVDVPRFRDESGGRPESAQWQQSALALRQSASLLLLCLWPLFVLEALFHWICRPWNGRTWRYQLFAAIHAACPPLRICPRIPELNGRIWLPGYGWRTSNDALSRELDRVFSIPMIVFALLIMPILLLENFFRSYVAGNEALRAGLHISTGIIWIAFTFEFIVKCSVSRRKVQYCKENWIDLLIILLPLVAFLRTFRALRLARLASLSYATRMSRVYRLRGVWMKAMRSLVVLDVVDLILRRNADKKLQHLREKQQHLEQALRDVRRQIRDLEAAQTDSYSEPDGERAAVKPRAVPQSAE